ncbi:MAG: hypothetical protein WC511_06605 [Candidatus Pacearchaeota archaeon]
MGNSQNEATQEPKDLEQEVAEEQAQLVEKPIDQIKQSIIEKYGLNEIDHENIITKLVDEQKEQQKKFSTLMAQKIRRREENEKLKQQLATLKTEVKPQTNVSIPADITSVVNEILDNKSLENSDLPDELKSEAKMFAKLNKVPLSQALKSDYIQFKKNKIDQGAKIDSASTSGGNRVITTRDLSNIDTTKLDLRKPEDRKTWEEIKEWRKNQ